MEKNNKKGLNLITSNGARKALFSISLSVGMLLVAGQALAAAQPSPIGTQTTTAAKQDVLFNRAVTPCIMMGQSSAMGTYSFRDCDNVMYGKGYSFSHSRGNMGAWIGLMFVLTVMMVWAVLLLLIAVLWHHLKKHKH